MTRVDKGMPVPQFLLRWGVLQFFWGGTIFAGTWTPDKVELGLGSGSGLGNLLGLWLGLEVRVGYSALIGLGLDNECFRFRAMVRGRGEGFMPNEPVSHRMSWRTPLYIHHFTVMHDPLCLHLYLHGIYPPMHIPFHCHARSSLPPSMGKWARDLNHSRVI